MKEVKFSGLRPKGTLNPRRLWRPGDTVQLEDDVAETLLREHGFSVVTRRRRPKKARE